MEARVIKPYTDKNGRGVKTVGMTVDETPERIAELAGYVEPIEEAEDATEAEEADFDGMTVAELREEAKSRGLEAPARATKRALIALLEG